MVLIVDDDAAVRGVLAAALEDEGWAVETADNGRTALEVVTRHRPDAIVLDLRMPVMDGMAFAERYQHFPSPRAPVILVSATVTEEAIRQTGAVHGLRKPIDLETLLDTVERHARSTG